MKRLDQQIARYIKQKEDFIQAIRQVFNETPDIKERSDRLEIFDTLLLYATYVNADELERELTNCLPSKDSEDHTLAYICQQLQELNAFCMVSYDEDHTIYQKLYAEVTYLTPKIKEQVREKLSKAMIEMVLDNTPNPASAKEEALPLGFY